MEKQKVDWKWAGSFLAIFLIIVVTATLSYSCYSTCDSFSCFSCTILPGIFFVAAILSLVKLLISFMLIRDKILRRKQVKHAVLLFVISMIGFLLNSIHG